MEQYELKIRSIDGVVPRLISDVILKREVSYPSFKYIKYATTTGTQTDSMYYVIVNFLLEKALEDYPVEYYCNKNFEIELDAKDVTIIETKDFNLYEVDTTHKRIQKIKMKKRDNPSYGFGDGIKFSLKLCAFTCDNLWDTPLQENLRYFRDSFRERSPILNCAAHMDNSEHGTESIKDTNHVLTVQSILPLPKIFDILLYIIVHIRGVLDKLSIEDLKEDDDTYNSTLFHYIQAISDSTKVPGQAANVNNSTIIGYSKTIFNKALLIEKLNKYEVLLKKAEKDIHR